MNLDLATTILNELSDQKKNILELQAQMDAFLKAVENLPEPKPEIEPEPSPEPEEIEKPWDTEGEFIEYSSGLVAGPGKGYWKRPSALEARFAQFQPAIAKAFPGADDPRGVPIEPILERYADSRGRAYFTLKGELGTAVRLVVIDPKTGEPSRFRCVKIAFEKQDRRRPMGYDPDYGIPWYVARPVDQFDISFDEWGDSQDASYNRELAIAHASSQRTLLNANQRHVVVFSAEKVPPGAKLRMVPIPFKPVERPPSNFSEGMSPTRELVKETKYEYIKPTMKEDTP